jgi:hypothetical protein
MGQAQYILGSLPKIQEVLAANTIENLVKKLV